MITAAARIAVAELYLKAAEEVAKRINSEQVNVVVDFLTSSSCMIHPETDRGFHSGQPLCPNFCGKQGERWVWVYVFDQGDLPYLNPQCIGPLNLRCSDNMAGYHHENRFLKLRSDRGELSSFARAALMVHEGRHAYLQQVVGEVGKTPRHEYNVCSFEHTWLSDLGGSEYKELLERTIKAHRTALLTQLAKPSQACGLPYPNELDRIFGAARGVFDKAMRATQLYRHAQFTILQRDGLPLADQVEKLRPLIC